MIFATTLLFHTIYSSTQLHSAEKRTFHTDAMCCICLERFSNILFEPCGHIATCKQCGTAERLDECPMCRTQIQLRTPLEYPCAAAGCIDWVCERFHSECPKAFTYRQGDRCQFREDVEKSLKKIPREIKYLSEIEGEAPQTCLTLHKNIIISQTTSILTVIMKSKKTTPKMQQWWEEALVELNAALEAIVSLIVDYFERSLTNEEFLGTCKQSLQDADMVVGLWTEMLYEKKEQEISIEKKKEVEEKMKQSNASEKKIWKEAYLRALRKQ